MSTMLKFIVIGLSFLAFTTMSSPNAESELKLRTRDAAGLLVDPAALRVRLEQAPNDPRAQTELADLLAHGELDGLRQDQLESLLVAKFIDPKTSESLKQKLQRFRDVGASALAELQELYVRTRAWCVDHKPSDLPLPDGHGRGTRFAQVPAEYVISNPDRQLAAVLVEDCVRLRPEDLRQAEAMDLAARWYGPAVLADQARESGYRVWAATLRDPQRQLSVDEIHALLGVQADFLVSHVPTLLKDYQPVTEMQWGKFKEPTALKLTSKALPYLAVASNKLWSGEYQGALDALDSGTESMRNPLEVAQQQAFRGLALYNLHRPEEAVIAFRAALQSGTLPFSSQVISLRGALQSLAELGDRPGFEALVMEYATKAGLAERYRL